MRVSVKVSVHVEGVRVRVPPPWTFVALSVADAGDELKGAPLRSALFLRKSCALSESLALRPLQRKVADARL